MSLSATKLRQNLYSILDQVLETGVPVQVERNGRLLVIEPQAKKSKWSRLEEHEIVNGDPEGIIHVDWSGEWKGSPES
jgi:PHD/YefM family antitoxin component YafN of YafNO toxin-antitoxin module